MQAVERALHVLQTDPTRFLSGSDDGTVRLWSIADESAVACIDSKANVCSVQFSPTDSNLMAFGSANYRVYLYDLRQVRIKFHSVCVCCVCICLHVHVFALYILLQHHVLGSGMRTVLLCLASACCSWSLVAVLFINVGMYHSEQTGLCCPGS